LFKLKQITGLGRPLDFRVASNRHMSILMLAVGVIALIVQLTAQMPVLDAGVWAFQTAMSVFLAWAIARELDPDHPISAILAAGFATLLIWWANPSDLFVLAWVLVALRASIGTVGLPLTWLDIAFVTIAGGWLMYSYNCLLALLLISVYSHQIRLKTKKKLMWFLFALTSIGVIGLILLDLLNIYESTRMPDVWSIWAGLIGIIYIIVHFPNYLRWRRKKEEATLESTDDVNDQPLLYASFIRIHLIVGLIGVSGAVGMASVGIMPFWIGLFAISICSLFNRIRQNRLPR
jgi:hypothetical protein